MLCILTYTTESYRRITEAILEKNSVEFGYDPVVQYSRLANEVIELSGEKRPVIINEIEERLLLDSIIAANSSSLKSKLRSICRTDRFVRDALAVIHSLLQSGLEPDNAKSLADSKDAGPEIADVLKLYVEFCKALSYKNLATQTGVCWDAARSCKRGFPDHPVAKAGVVLVEDFQDIDPGQFELLFVIAPPEGPGAVTFLAIRLAPCLGTVGRHERFLLSKFTERYGADTVCLAAGCRDIDAEGKTMEALLVETLGSDAECHLPVIRIDNSGEISGDDRIERAFSLEIVGDELDEAYNVGAKIERSPRSPVTVNRLTSPL